MSDSSLALVDVPPEDQHGLVDVGGVNAGFTHWAAQKTNDPHRICRRGR